MGIAFADQRICEAHIELGERARTQHRDADSDLQEYVSRYTAANDFVSREFARAGREALRDS